MSQTTRATFRNPFMSKSLVSKILAANTTLIAQGNLDAIGDFFSPEYVAHVTGQDMALGHADIRKVLTLNQRAFPDLTVEVEILVATKDRVAWQRTLRGEQQGAYKGFPASGRAIVWRDVVTSRFENGLIAEEWFITDLAEQLLRSRKR